MKKLLFILILATLVVVELFILVKIRSKPVVTDLIINNGVGEINMGNIVISSKQQFKISLANMTGKTFEVAKIYTSCSCTGIIAGESEPIPMTIKSKQTSYVNLEFDPSSMHRVGDIVDHEVYFLITNPFEKEYKVKIIGKIV